MTTHYMDRLAGFAPRPVSLERGARYVLTALALALALGGGVATARLLFAPQLTAAIGETVEAGPLLFAVNNAVWIGHDHGPEDPTQDVTLAPDAPDTADPARDAALQMGFAMPPSMMPGLPPEGMHRLSIDLSLQNIGWRTEAIAVDEFHVEAADGQVWRPLAMSFFRAKQLVPRQGMGTVIFVDVPEDAPAPAIVWQRGNARVTIPLDGVPGHDAH